jgi:hypothetical protein
MSSWENCLDHHKKETPGGQGLGVTPLAGWLTIGVFVILVTSPSIKRRYFDAPMLEGGLVKHLFGFVVAVALAVGAAGLVVSDSSDAASTMPNYWGLAY